MEWWSNGRVQHTITPTRHYSLLLCTSAPRIAEVATAVSHEFLVSVNGLLIAQTVRNS
jgi:hypothetical protein